MRCPGERMGLSGWRAGHSGGGTQHCGKVGGESEEPKVTSDF